jgi:DNA-directed RNA polymerase alpha subunit
MKEDTTQIDPTWMDKTGGYAKDMTLRDHFAGLAMQAYVMDEAIFRDLNTSVHWLKTIAECAYEQADEMLKKRKPKKFIPEDKLFSMEVNELALTMRSVNCLRADGIKTVGDLMQTTRWNLMKVPNLGKKSLFEIEEVLEKLNLKLRAK